MIDTNTVAALACGVHIDDVGSLVVLWHDHAVDDEAFGYDITSTVLHSTFSGDKNNADERGAAPRHNLLPKSSTDAHATNKPHCVLSLWYGGVLRAVR